MLRKLVEMDQGQEPTRQWPALVKRGLVNGECLRRGFSPTLLLDHRRFGYSGDKSQRAVATRALIKFQPIASGDGSNGYECSCRTARDTIGFTEHGSNPPVKDLIAMIPSHPEPQFSTHIALAREQDIKASQKNKWCCSKAIFKNALLSS